MRRINNGELPTRQCKCPTVSGIKVASKPYAVRCVTLRGNRERRGVMRNQESQSDIEALARIAARLAGRNPDERVTIKLADVTAFDGVMWRYPDFVRRAEAAYEVLRSDYPPRS